MSPRTAASAPTTASTKPPAAQRHRQLSADPPAASPPRQRQLSLAPRRRSSCCSRRCCASLALIATGAVLGAVDIENPIVTFLSSPVIALLIGLIGTSFVSRHTVGAEAVQRAIATGFKESGQILILTGVGGSLAATIKAAGLGDILGEYFTANTAAPILMVWVIAVALHIAIGSVTISAITSAGILAPAVAIGIDPVLIALAAGAGSLFAVHVTSNTFWLLQSLLGQSTRGTLKTCTVGVSVASVIALLLLLPMGYLL